MKKNKSLFTIALLIYCFVSIRCTGQTTKVEEGAQKKDSVFTFYTYGMPSAKMHYAREKVAKKWGIVYKTIAGCEVADEIVQLTKKHNDSVSELVAKKYGENWRVKFDNELYKASKNYK